MIQDNLEGYLPQHESWKYILRVMEDETIVFKTKLAHILSHDFDRSHLGHLEVFQHRFLKMDEQIGLLRHEVRELQETIQYNSREIAIHPASGRALQDVLAAKIDRIQDNFDALTADFKLYLQRFFPGI